MVKTTIYFKGQGYEIHDHETFKHFLKRSPSPLKGTKFLNTEYCGVNLNQTFGQFHKQWPKALHFFPTCDYCHELLANVAVSCPVCKRNVHEECYEDHYDKEKCSNCGVNVLGCYWSGSTCDECEEPFCESCRQNGHKFCEGCAPDSDEDEESLEEKLTKENKVLKDKVLELEKKIKKQHKNINLVKKRSHTKPNTITIKINKN